MVELADIVGQSVALGQLAKSAQAGRLPHAFLFVGPTGVGRRTTATAFAKTLLCGSPVKVQITENGGTAETNQACNQCEDCKMFASGTHPDFVLIYKELARYHSDASVRDRKMQDMSIGVIRSFLIAQTQRASTRGRGKIFVVKEAELMSIPAQNALLKTLEEPPVGVTIILISNNADQMLPTTVSRCCTVHFGPLETDFVTEQLKASGVESTEANFWATFSNGSIGEATRLGNQDLYEIKQEMIEQIASPDSLGQADLGSFLAEKADKLADTYVKQAKKVDKAELSKLLATRRAAGVMLRLIARAFSDAIIVATGSNLPQTNTDQPDAIDALAGRFDKIQLAEILQQLGRFESLLWRNVNPKTVWDNVAITCRSAAALPISLGS